MKIHGVLFYIIFFLVSYIHPQRAYRKRGPPHRPHFQEINHLNALDSLRNSIPGEPFVDYPVYSDIPQTQFKCNGKVDGSYYADTESNCQVFHICSDLGGGVMQRFSFLCPNGTMFMQRDLVCQWWYLVDCPLSEEFYPNNVLDNDQEEFSGQLVQDKHTTKQFRKRNRRRGNGRQKRYRRKRVKVPKRSFKIPNVYRKHMNNWHVKDNWQKVGSNQENYLQQSSVYNEKMLNEIEQDIRDALEYLS